MPAEVPIHWVGTSKKDLLAFPEQAVANIGYALGVAQLGGKHPDAKPWKGDGPGVFEIVEAFDGDAYRLVYTVRFSDAIYVLHSFQKKSPKGIATDKRDRDLIGRRLKLAQEARVAGAAKRAKGKE